MIFKEKLALKNCKNFLVAKALVNAYILCEIRVELCLTRAAQKVFSALGSNFVGQLIVSCPFNIQYYSLCSSIRNCIAYGNEANIVNKDSPIDGTISDET